MKFKKISLHVLILIFCISLIILPVYAIFFNSSKIEGNINFGVVSDEETVFTSEAVTNLTFKNLGEKKDYKLNLKSISTKNIEYYYSISSNLMVNGLENAILVYFDNKFIGNLAQVIANDSLKLCLNYIERQDNSTKIKENLLTFELHNSVNIDIYANKTFKLKLECKAQTANIKDNIFVSNEEEFKKAVDDINKSKATRTIRIANNIVLNNSYTFFSGAAIDLMGNKLQLNNSALNFCDDNINANDYMIFSSVNILKNNYPNINNASGFILNGDKSLLILDDSAAIYSSLFSVVKYDSAKFNHLLKNYINKKLSLGIAPNTNVDILGGLKFYETSKAVSIISNDINCNYLNGVVSFTALNYNYISSIKVNDEIIEFKVIADRNELLADEIWNNELKHISSLEGNRDVSFDLFLPNTINAKNATISYISTKPSLMDSNGKIIGEFSEGEVTIICQIKINDDIYIKEVTFFVLKQNNEMRLEYLLTRIGNIVLSSIYNVSSINNDANSYVDLPTVNNYINITDGKDLGISSIIYEIDPIYNFTLLEGNNRVCLIEPTFQSYMQVKISVLFKNDAKLYEGNIGVTIILGNSIDLHDKVADYIQGIFSSVNVLQLIYDSRVAVGIKDEQAKFTMPLSYRNFNISYYVTDEIANVDNTGNFTVNLEKLKGINYSVPVKVKINIEGAGLNDLYSERILNFKTPPAIHNNLEGFADISVYNSIKLQVLQQANDSGIPKIESGKTYNIADFGRDYILLNDILLCKNLKLNLGDKEYISQFTTSNLVFDQLYYFNIPKLTVQNFIGLKNFINLEKIEIKGEQNNFMFSNTKDADIFTELISTACKKINNFTLSYCNLNSIDFIANYKDINNKIDINYLDISGNNLVKNLKCLNDNSVYNLKYLDTSFTGINFNYEESVYNNLYYCYKKVNFIIPQYYYLENGEKKLFTPKVNDDTLKLNSYLFYLKEIDNISTLYFQLKMNVYGDKLYNVVWNVISVTKQNEADTLTLIIDKNRLVLNGGGKGSAIITASVTDNGNTATRYFTITLN